MDVQQVTMALLSRRLSVLGRHTSQDVPNVQQESTSPNLHQPPRQLALLALVRLTAWQVVRRVQLLVLMDTSLQPPLGRLLPLQAVLLAQQERGLLLAHQLLFAISALQGIMEQQLQQPQLLALPVQLGSIESRAVLQ